jgi:hypothetical protein
MPDRGAHSYPPVGDPDRLDAIVQRGRSLRRRRQLGAAGAGAGGAFLVALVAVVVFSGSSGSNEQLLADDGTTTTSTTTTTTTVTTVPPPQEMTVELVQGPPAQIVVDDPEQPVGEGTQQCLTVAVYSPDSPPDAGGIASAEGTVCAPGLSESGTADLALVPSTSSEAGADPGAEVGTDLGTGSTEIGCAASVVRPAADAGASTETRPGITTFTLSAPDLSPGPYLVSVAAVSGIGDGCPEEQPGLERENVAKVSGTLTLP